MSNHTLRSLNLEANGLGASGSGADQEGIIRLAKALKDGKNDLQVLNLSRNNVGPPAADALLECLHKNHQISVLDLSGNPDVAVKQYREIHRFIMRNRKELSKSRRRERQERFKLFE